MFEIHSAKVQKNQNQKLNKFVFQSLFVCLRLRGRASTRIRVHVRV